MTREEQTAQVLDLLDRSLRAYDAGDEAESHRLRDEALQLDALCVSAVVGGIQIGEIPNPASDPLGWADYVAAARERADADAAEGAQQH